MLWRWTVLAFSFASLLPRQVFLTHPTPPLLSPLINRRPSVTASPEQVTLTLLRRPH